MRSQAPKSTFLSPSAPANPLRPSVYIGSELGFTVVALALKRPDARAVASDACPGHAVFADLKPGCLGEVRPELNRSSPENDRSGKFGAIHGESALNGCTHSRAIIRRLHGPPSGSSGWIRCSFQPKGFDNHGQWTFFVHSKALA